MDKEIALIGYSGHAYVVAEILLSQGRKVSYYCEPEPQKDNPFDLNYLGDESKSETIERLQSYNYALAIGDNLIREKIFRQLTEKLHNPINAIHPEATLSSSVKLGDGVVVAAQSAINALAELGDGVICNTGCVIEHECTIGNFSHIAPSATLLGNVNVGERCLIGGNSTINPGITIGDNVVVGAGSVILEDIPSNVVVAGNPPRVLTNKNKQRK